MPESSRNFSEELREALVSLLWRQWSALGVAGSVSAETDRLIDPEALLLLSTVMARHDPRLFDEILDWLGCFGDRINLQRLKRLLDTRGIGDATVLAALAGKLARTAALRKWSALARRGARPVGEPRPLFLHPRTTVPLPVYGRRDPDFLAQGWIRPPHESRGLSVPPVPEAAPAFLLRLRALFGVQARAEIVAALLACESATPAELARLTGYTPRTVEVTVRDLAGTGLVHRHRQGREIHCRVIPHEWAMLRPATTGAFPPWIDWSARFSALLALLAVFDRQSQLSPLLWASELRRVTKEHAAALLAQGVRLNERPADKAFVENLTADLRNLLKSYAG